MKNPAPGDRYKGAAAGAGVLNLLPLTPGLSNQEQAGASLSHLFFKGGRKLGAKGRAVENISTPATGVFQQYPERLAGGGARQVLIKRQGAGICWDGGRGRSGHGHKCTVAGKPASNESASYRRACSSQVHARRYDAHSWGRSAEGKAQGPAQRGRMRGWGKTRRWR